MHFPASIGGLGMAIWLADCQWDVAFRKCARCKSYAVGFDCLPCAGRNAGTRQLSSNHHGPYLYDNTLVLITKKTGMNLVSANRHFIWEYNILSIKATVKLGLLSHATPSNSYKYSVIDRIMTVWEQGPCLFESWVYLEHLEWCLVHGRYSVNIYRGCLNKIW